MQSSLHFRKSVFCIWLESCEQSEAKYTKYTHNLAVLRAHLQSELCASSKTNKKSYQHNFHNPFQLQKNMLKYFCSMTFMTIVFSNRDRLNAVKPELKVTNVLSTTIILFIFIQNSNYNGSLQMSTCGITCSFSSLNEDTSLWYDKTCVSKF